MTTPFWVKQKRQRGEGMTPVAFSYFKKSKKKRHCSKKTFTNSAVANVFCKAKDGF